MVGGFKWWWFKIVISLLFINLSTIISLILVLFGLLLWVNLGQIRTKPTNVGWWFMINYKKVL